jgi:hypothetical protein
LWSSYTHSRVSADGAASFADVPNTGTFSASLLGTSATASRLFLIPDRPDTNQCEYSIDSGATWTTLPVIPQGIQSWRGFTRWQGNFFQTALVVGTATGGAPVGTYLIWRHQAGAASWDDKMGNLATFGPEFVYDVDRDSMGSA